MLYVGDGQVWTSAGTAAAIDLCLHFVRMDHGGEVANVVARRMVTPARRDGGPSRYVLTPVPAPATDDGLGPTLDWAVDNLDRELSVEDLARRAKMSPRTVARRFMSATGTTPLQWVLTRRVLLAQRLLEGNGSAGGSGGPPGRVRVVGDPAPTLRSRGGYVAARLPPDVPPRRVTEWKRRGRSSAG
jgi:AraC family transcriptional activator FtrA